MCNGCGIHVTTGEKSHVILMRKTCGIQATSFGVLLGRHFIFFSQCGEDRIRCCISIMPPKKNSKISGTGFVIVEFIEDNPVSVQAIPRTWLISDTECYWPTGLKLNQLNNLLSDKSSKPNTKDWDKSTCRILGEKGKGGDCVLIAECQENKELIPIIIFI